MSNETKPMIIVDEENGREYTLEFNRRTVVRAEQAGLDISKLDSYPMTMIPILFWCAFLYHHPYMTKEQTDKILFEGLGGIGKDEIVRLAALYAEPFQTLISEEEGTKNPRKMAVR